MCILVTSIYKKKLHCLPRALKATHCQEGQNDHLCNVLKFILIRPRSEKMAWKRDIGSKNKGCYFVLNACFFVRSKGLFYGKNTNLLISWLHISFLPHFICHVFFGDFISAWSMQIFLLFLIKIHMVWSNRMIFVHWTKSQLI